MIESIVLNYLLDNGIEAYMEMPERPNENISIIEKTSSANFDQIKRATIVIQSYGDSLLNACKNNEKIKELMANIVSLDSIGACKLNSDYNYTNITTKKYRYQAVFDIIYY